MSRLFIKIRMSDYEKCQSVILQTFKKRDKFIYKMIASFFTFTTLAER